MIVHCLYYIGNFTENLIGVYSTPEKAQEISSKIKELQSGLDPEYFAYSTGEFHIIEYELDEDTPVRLKQCHDLLKALNWKIGSGNGL